MPTAGSLKIEGRTVVLQDDWVLSCFNDLRKQVHAARPGAELPADDVDWSALKHLDSAGATLIAELLGSERLTRLAEADTTLAPERKGLLLTVARAMSGLDATPPTRTRGIRQSLAAVGRTITGFAKDQKLLAGFIGLTLTTLAAIVLVPRRWRVTALVAHVQRTGLNALPIVALLTFLVGAVVAFLGATVLENFGATIYTVHLVTFAFLREFGVVLAAILLAGRTASAYTAQLGSMKANQEIDALRASGLDPMEMLVIPRVLAMVISLPFLTFVGMVSGILGGALVCLYSLDISATQFVSIIEQDIPLNHFLVGLGKAPVFAFVIAVIGCLEGLKVSGSAESVGQHTTSSVVQSIFMVILLDAIAALFFMEMGW
ncbi:MlaE family ABC transporter permease [Marinobacter zhanjiangensis]|uniref:ABC transporter permease n=1 Tax=Marinobacter zhanjiangensis TaxID=578215 RepID=A0ABQ3AUZ8_9GAMM|nr:ABC transporter permease [Marinobacter zhanjiangensis]GGY66944.1 ABC transporter permease [Marinobacter zhanjiangensis]